MAKLLNIFAFVSIFSLLIGCQNNDYSDLIEDGDKPGKGDVIGQTLYLEDGSTIRTQLVVIKGYEIYFECDVKLKSNPKNPRFYSYQFGYFDCISLNIWKASNKTILGVRFKISEEMLYKFEYGTTIETWCDFGLPKLSGLTTYLEGTDEENGMGYYSFYVLTLVNCTINEEGNVTFE